MTSRHEALQCPYPAMTLQCQATSISESARSDWLEPCVHIAQGVARQAAFGVEAKFHVDTAADKDAGVGIGKRRGQRAAAGVPLLEAIAAGSASIRIGSPAGLGAHGGQEGDGLGH